MSGETTEIPQSELINEYLALYDRMDEIKYQFLNPIKIQLRILTDILTDELQKREIDVVESEFHWLIAEYYDLNRVDFEASRGGVKAITDEYGNILKLSVSRDVLNGNEMAYEPVARTIVMNLIKQ